MNYSSNDIILALIEQSPDGIQEDIAARVKKRRLELNLTQKALAARAGLAFPTYRRFETSGEISLRNLIKLGFALDAATDFGHLFAQRKYETLDALRQSQRGKPRKRGSVND